MDMTVESRAIPLRGQESAARITRGLLAVATVAALATAYASINFFFYLVFIAVGWFIRWWADARATERTGSIGAEVP